MERKDRIGRALKLKDLHTFRAVAERRSMVKAAAALAVTPAAISKSISEMEALLGVRLLERTPKGVVPTPFGEVLLDGSVGLFDELAQTIRRLESLADPTAGESRIGAADFTLTGLVTAVLGQLSRQHPRMAFHIKTANDPGEFRSMLRARAIDVFISRINAEPEDDLDKEVLFDDPLVVITHRDDSRFRGRKVQLAQLTEEAWCMPDEEHMIGALIRQAFRTQRLGPPRVCISSPSMALQAAMAQKGRFLSVVSASYLGFRSDKESFRVVPVDLRVNPPPIGIVTLKGRVISPTTSLFIQSVRALAKQRGAPRGRQQ